MDRPRRSPSLRTRAVAAGRPHAAGEPLNAPLVPASNFAYGDAGPGSTRAYSREDGTPTWEALEATLGELEGADGARCVSFASGMAAIAAVFELAPAGVRVALPDDCYQGVSALAAHGESKGRFVVERIGVADTAAWIDALERCSLVWLETPSNPLLELSDLDAIGAAARTSDALLVVDNTFATPIAQRPLERGADLVVHSATKFVGGHSDLLCGAVVARDADRARELRHTRSTHGATPGALEAFLALRGARTLALRVEAATANAHELARRLEAHPAVESVRYPGLASHPQHALATRQLDGFGAMVSFVVRGGARAATAVCAGLALVHHATSLGGVESTIERRAALAGQEHLPAGLVRLSVGIEEVADLWADLDAALAASQR